MPQQVQSNGMLSQMVGLKAQKEAQQKQDQIGIWKSIVADQNDNYSPSQREMAAKNLHALASDIVGGGNGRGSGNSGTKDNPLLSLFHAAIDKAHSITGSRRQQQQSAAAAPDAAPDAAPKAVPYQEPMLQSQEQKDARIQQQANLAQKIALARAKAEQEQAAQVKREQNQQDYEQEYKRLLPSLGPGRAAEEANAIAAGRAVPAAEKTERTTTARDDAFQAYADANSKDVKSLTAAEKIAAVKATSGKGTAKAPTKEEVAYAEKHGKKPEELTGSEKLLAVKEARETERLPQRPSLQSGATGPAAEIKEGTPEYEIAKDLASGKLTFAEFRGLYSYSRDATKRAAIYNKATEINPAFNAAAFDRGFKFSSNVSVQKQIASIENVKSGVKDLLKMSDEAERMGVTLLNNAIVKGGITIGNRKYSDFKTARIAFADELSGALGYGSATDMSREMGFNMTDPALGPKAFKSAIENVIVPFIERKKKSLTDQMGPYAPGDAGTGSGAADPLGILK
jgi:hypothetical protein